MITTLSRPARRPVRRRSYVGLLMVLPSLAILGLFSYYPILVAAIRSFQSFNPFTQAVTGFVGFANYQAIFSDPAFRQATLNTVLYIVVPPLVPGTCGAVAGCSD